MHFFRNFDWLPCEQRFLSCTVLSFTKSFKWLVCRVVGLFMLQEKRDRQAMQEQHLCSQGSDWFEFPYRILLF